MGDIFCRAENRMVKFGHHCPYDLCNYPCGKKHWDKDKQRFYIKKNDMAVVEVADACDYGHQSPVCVRLSLPGNAGVYLCPKHWDVEMRWRKQRNKELSTEAQYDILPWPIEEKDG